MSTDNIRELIGIETQADLSALERINQLLSQSDTLWDAFAASGSAALSTMERFSVGAAAGMAALNAQVERFIGLMSGASAATQTIQIPSYFGAGTGAIPIGGMGAVPMLGAGGAGNQPPLPPGIMAGGEEMPLGGGQFLMLPSGQAGGRTEYERQQAEWGMQHEAAMRKAEMLGAQAKTPAEQEAYNYPGGRNTPEEMAALRGAGLALPDEEVARQTGNWNRVGVEIEETGKKAGAFGGNIRGAYQESRGLMMGMLGLSMVMSEFATATGEKADPAVKSLVQGLSAMTRFGMMGTFMAPMLKMAPETGMIGGLGIGAIVALAGALEQVRPEVQAVNDELDKLAQKDTTVQTLAELTGWTRQEASEAMQAAKSINGMATAMQNVVTWNERLRLINQGGWQGIQGSAQAMTDFLGSPEFQRAASGKEQYTATQAFQDFFQRQAKEYGANQQISQVDLAKYQFEQPYSKILGALDTAAQSEKDAAGLAKLTGESEDYSKSLLKLAEEHPELASRIEDTAKAYMDLAEAQDLAKKGIAVAGPLQDKSAIDKQWQDIKTQAESFQKASVKPSFEMTQYTPDQFKQILAYSTQIGDAYLAQLQSIDQTGKLVQQTKDQWGNLVVVMRLADGTLKTITGEQAAMLSQSEGLVKAYQHPSIQTMPDLTPQRAQQLQGYLTKYSGLLKGLGVQQTPQEYMMFGQGGSLYKYTTTQEAMSLAMDMLREEVKKNTDQLDKNDQSLRGSYNIPTSFGYVPPTPHDYYASGAHDMGPVNYPWMFDQEQSGYMKGKKLDKFVPTLGSVPGGITQSFTTPGLDTASTIAARAPATVPGNAAALIGALAGVGMMGAHAPTSYTDKREDYYFRHPDTTPAAATDITGMQSAMTGTQSNTASMATRIPSGLDRLAGGMAQSNFFLQSISLQLVAMTAALARPINIYVRGGGGGENSSSGFGSGEPAAVGTTGTGQGMAGANTVSAMRG